MTQATTVWQNVLMAELPGATWDFVDQVVCETVNEFYTRTGAWIEDLLYDIRANRTVYNLNPVVGRDVEVLYVNQVRINDELVPLGQPEQLSTMSTGAWVRPAATLHLNAPPLEDITKGLRVTVALRPKMCAGEVPDEAVLLYFDTIKNGAMGRLKAMTSKPWSDPAGAAVCQRRFRNGMSEARDMARRGHSRIDSSWSFPPWA
jgi:hypothetical protein